MDFTAVTNNNLQTKDGPIAGTAPSTPIDFNSSTERGAVGLYNLGTIRADLIIGGTITGIVINGGTITGGTINGALITGGTVQTSEDGERVAMIDNRNSLAIYGTAGTIVAELFYDTSLNLTALYGYGTANEVNIWPDGILQLISGISLTPVIIELNDSTSLIKISNADLALQGNDITDVHNISGPEGTIDLNGAFTDGIDITSDFHPTSAGSQDLGNATVYWGDINYKTLTDRGCLGWFDKGVKLQDGREVSDVEALQEIKKHPTKKTIYGEPMLDYSSLPVAVYKPAADKEGNLALRDPVTDEPYIIKKKRIKKEFQIDPDDPRLKGLNRRQQVKKAAEIKRNAKKYDEVEERVPASDGAETTALLSIMLGAIKDLDNRLKAAGI